MRWSRILVAPLEGRAYARIFRAPGGFIVWGGVGRHQARYVMDGASCELESGVWRVIPPAPLSGRESAAVADIPGGIFVWGGVSKFVPRPEPVADGALFAFERGWTTLPRSPLGPRASSTAVWTGHAVLVWGGWADSAASGASDGALFDPGALRWFPIPPCPLQATPTRSFWNGKHLIIVGGASTALGSGGFIRFDRSGVLAEAQSVGKASSTGASAGAAPSPAWFDAHAGRWEVLPAPAVDVTDCVARWVGDCFLCVRPDASAFTWAPETGETSETAPLPGGSDAFLRQIGHAGLDGWAVFLAAGRVTNSEGAAEDGVIGWAWERADERWSEVPPAPFSGVRFGAALAAAGRGVTVWGGMSQADGATVFHADGAFLHR